MEKKFWRITLDTNPEDCNLQCIMCEEHSPFSDFKQKLFQKTGVKVRRMPGEWLEPIFNTAKEMGITEIIPSTMGEPLLFKDFDKLVELYHESGIRMNLTTNGTFPKKPAGEWAKLLVPILSDIKISWNGATKETSEKVMLDLDFSTTIQNVKDFIAERDQQFLEGGNYCRVTFQLTFMQNNMHELAGIVKLAASLGVDRVKGHQLWAHFDEIKSLSFKTNEAARNQWNQYVQEAYDAAEEFRRPNGEKVILEQIIPLLMGEEKEVPEHYECPFLGKELWISATGKIAPCCAPDEMRQSLGDFGTYPQTGIEDAIESEAYQKLLIDYKSRSLCKGCNMRKPLFQNKILQTLP